MTLSKNRTRGLTTETHDLSAVTHGTPARLPGRGPRVTAGFRDLSRLVRLSQAGTTASGRRIPAVTDHHSKTPPHSSKAYFIFRREFVIGRRADHIMVRAPSDSDASRRALDLGLYSSFLISSSRISKSESFDLFGLNAATFAASSLASSACFCFSLATTPEAAASTLSSGSQDCRSARTR